MMIAEVVTDSVTELRPQSWRTADRLPALRSGELHVWLFQIGRSQEFRLASTLSRDEMERAAKFKHPEHRAEFVVCRGALRVLLGHYVGLDAAHVQILYTEDGKPFVDYPSSNMKFNISHSHEYALFAFSLGLEVGVDIEWLDAGVIDDAMLKHCLHDNELAKHNALAADEKTPFFFKCWTMKESYLKLRGDGFAVSPTEIDLLPMQGSELGFGEVPACFTELPHIDAYAAIVATRNKPQNISCYKLDSSLFR